MKRYNPKEIEPKWQQKWQESEIYKATEDSTKPKRYVLEYFPYPSGAAMHVGHVRNYTIGDAIARFSRMRGENVLYPMGWDSFGLPAENFAIKNNISPRQAIEQNTTKFKQQLTQMGFSYDWSREIDSSKPEYYRWTQWFFKLLFDRGLAYQKDSLQWWCETDKTVLANEQVEAGKCWRCGNPVIKKPLKQWFFKITDYADRLVEDLEDLDWSDSIKSMQRNWIGKSKGAELDFKVEGCSDVIRVYTTRPDTLFGATFMVLAPEHELVAEITTEDQKSAVGAYIKQAQSKSDVERQEMSREKTGVFTGAYAINPVNEEKIPVWIADYVLTGYGTGAIMAVPAHDERDLEFAQKFDLQVRQVVAPRFVDTTNPHVENKELITRQVVSMIVKHPEKDEYLIGLPKGGTSWSQLMGGIDAGENPVETARRELLEETGFDDIKLVEERGSVIASEFFAAHKDVNRIAYSHVVYIELASLSVDAAAAIDKDKQEVKWVSEKEYRSHRDEGGMNEVLDMALNRAVEMPKEGRLVNSGPYDGVLTSDAREQIVTDLAKSGVGEEKVNYKIRDWLISRQRYWGAPIPIIHCEQDGAVAVPEDQLPVTLPELTNFQPTGNGSALAGATDWINTTCPKCGGPAKRETDTMDGFACSSWYFLRFADPHNTEEPFSKEKAKFWMPVDDYIGGAEHAVMHLLYSRMWTKVMFDAGLIEFNEPFKALRNHGMILAPDGRKMSKSWGNVISPDEIIEQGYGADAIRLMELFIGPWNQEAAWSVEGMGGCFRFLQRFWTLTQEFIEAPKTENTEQPELLVVTHKTIKKVSEDLRDMGFNTAIAALMGAVNELYKIKTDSGFSDAKSWLFALKTLTQLIAPFAPHIAEELWADLGKTESVHISTWPVHDEAYLVSDTMKIVVQVNGKVRAALELPADSSEETVIEAARQNEKVAAQIGDNPVKKSIYVPGKLVNFVA
jgi:leucyl-tRNA synthetase